MKEWVRRVEMQRVWSIALPSDCLLCVLEFSEKPKHTLMIDPSLWRKHLIRPSNRINLGRENEFWEMEKEIQEAHGRGSTSLHRRSFFVEARFLEVVRDVSTFIGRTYFGISFLGPWSRTRRQEPGDIVLSMNLLCLLVLLQFHKVDVVWIYRVTTSSKYNNPAGW